METNSLSQLIVTIMIITVTTTLLIGYSVPAVVVGALHLLLLLIILTAILGKKHYYLSLRADEAEAQKGYLKSHGGRTTFRLWSTQSLYYLFFFFLTFHFEMISYL